MNDDGQEGCSELLVEAALKPPGGSILWWWIRMEKKKCIRFETSTSRRPCATWWRHASITQRWVFLLLPLKQLHTSHQPLFDWYIVLYMQMMYCAMSGSFSHQAEMTCSCMFITDYLECLSNLFENIYNINPDPGYPDFPYSYRLKKYLYSRLPIFILKNRRPAAATYLMTPLSLSAPDWSTVSHHHMLVASLSFHVMQWPLKCAAAAAVYYRPIYTTLINCASFLPHSLFYWGQFLFHFAWLLKLYNNVWSTTTTLLWLYIHLL